MTEVTGNHRAPSGRKLKVCSTGEQARQAALVATQAAADAFGTGGVTASVTANHRLESGATASTVDGQPVQKVLPSGNGRATRARV